jgi:hypothetical protein
MTYTINGKEYTEFDINKRCAEILGLIVQTKFEKRIGFTEYFHQNYPNTVWCAEVDERGDQVSAWEQMVFTRCPENTWPIIEKCWDELMVVYITDGYYARWECIMSEHNCTKLVAACICLIELNE